MAAATLLLRERLIGDVTHEVLEEAVLAVLRRRRVGLHAEDLLARKRAEERVELGLGDTSQDCERVACEGLAEDRRVLEQTALFRRQSVEARGDEPVQRLRHFERGNLAGRAVDRALLYQQASVEQHPHRLDRVQRHSFSPREDLLTQ